MQNTTTMFSFPKSESTVVLDPAATEEPVSRPKYKNAYQSTPFDGGETNYSALEEMLEQEKQNNKAEAWKFTLKNLDTKRVSTLKSLTPKIRRSNAEIVEDTV
jgi:hypothetical protein